MERGWSVFARLGIGFQPPRKILTGKRARIRWWHRVFSLALLLAIAAACSWLGPGSDLHGSVWRAFDSSVGLLSQGDDKVDGMPECTPNGTSHRAATREPHQEGRGAGGPSHVAPRRKRITPFQAKQVGARQHWRCAMCCELLQEDFEVDHIVPLHQGGSFDNDINALQALHKRCHLLKNSIEQRRS